jgi:hypothetical protein
MTKRKNSTKRKNTLLYLDSELVKRAKSKGVNISEIAEKAIWSSLHEGNMGFNPREYLEKLFNEELAFLIPFRLESIKLNNIGPVKALDAKFDDFTMFMGENGTGKTAIINAIYSATTNTGEVEESGNIKIKTSQTDTVDIAFKRDRLLSGYKCLLIDDAFERLDTESAVKFLFYLERLKLQVITTVHPNKSGRVKERLDKFKIISLSKN